MIVEYCHGTKAPEQALAKARAGYRRQMDRRWVDYNKIYQYMKRENGGL